MTLPSAISGLVLWLDADAITGLSDGDTVTTWADQSGLGNDYTNPGPTAAVTYETNVLNGRPVVKMEVGGFTGPVSLVAPFTIFYVGHYTVGGSSARRAVQGASPSNWLLGPYSAAWQWYANGFATSGGAAGADWVAHGAIQEPDEIRVHGGHFVYDLDSNAVPTVNRRASPSDIGGLRLGNAGMWNETMGGELAEVVAFDEAITATDRIGLTDYFREKWGGIVASSTEDPDIEVRLAREAAVAAIDFPAASTQARLAREAAVVSHHFPEANTEGRVARLGLVVAISRPHGWGVFDDNATP